MLNGLIQQEENQTNFFRVWHGRGSLRGRGRGTGQTIPYATNNGVCHYCRKSGRYIKFCRLCIGNEGPEAVTKRNNIRMPQSPFHEHPYWNNCPKTCNRPDATESNHNREAFLAHTRGRDRPSSDDPSQSHSGTSGSHLTRMAKVKFVRMIAETNNDK